MEKRHPGTGDPGLGRRLRRSREVLGMTQAELARRVGLEQPSISEFETGSVSPSVQTVRRLARALGASPSYLIGGLQTEMPDDVERAAEDFLLALPAKTWRQIAKLSDEERAQALREVAALLAAKAQGRATKPPRRPR